jgi:hypothetical protein
MRRTNTKRRPKAESRPAQSPQLRKAEAPARTAEPEVHVFGKGFVCDTDTRGHATPRGRSPLEIVVDASEGFIPLWAKDMTLRWRFREHTLKYFANPSAAKTEIRKLLGEASWLGVTRRPSSSPSVKTHRTSRS